MNNDKVQHLRKMETLGEFVKSRPYSRKFECKNSNTNYIHYGDIHGKYDGFIDNETCIPYIDDVGDDNKSDYLKNGDIIFADASEDYADLGKTVFIEKVNKRKIVSGLHTHAFRPCQTIVYPLYLKYFTDSQVFRQEMYKRGQGISVLGISKKEISKIEVNLPSKELQVKYSFGLRQLDIKLVLLNQKLKNLKLFKRGLTDRIFHELEKNHPKKKLCDISERMFSGGTPRSTEKSYYGGDIKFLTISDITKSSKHLINVSKYITQLGLDNSSSKIVLPGTLIFTMYATIAIPIIAKTTVAIPQSVMAIELYENMDVDFIYYQLFSMTNLVRSKYTETGTQGNINSSIVKNLKLIIPDIATQITVSRKLNQMEKKIEMIENKLQSLKKFKRGLLQQVFI